MTYSDKLKDPRWQRRRLEIMQRDQFKCRRCGSSTKTLNVHHLQYQRGREPWQYEDNLLVTICEDCHESEHAARHLRREILTWPLLKVGDEQFFGYPIAIGFHPDRGGPKTQRWACFEYGETETIYLLPDDDGLFKALAADVAHNAVELSCSSSYSMKIWIKKTASGYSCEMP